MSKTESPTVRRRVCPTCGYRNDPGAHRCQGTVIYRGDRKTTCRKDLTDVPVTTVSASGGQA